MPAPPRRAPHDALALAGAGSATTAGIAGSPTPVTVTTLAGTATGAFTYDPDCEVPKLTGRKLKPAKQALLNAHCRPGKVTRAKGVATNAGQVVKQNPKQGTSRPAGAKVSLKLG